MTSKKKKDAPSLVDELGVKGTSEILFGKNNKLFSAAGRQAPVAEITSTGVILHPPHKPLEEEGTGEEITIKADEQGILLDALGQRSKVIGAKFKGFPIYRLAECIPNTGKHYVAWLDNDGKLHQLFYSQQPASADIIVRLRNKTHDGELEVYKELTGN